eukprot:CAMPEP_0182596208 /NCGR_PEP_ID=MMETSP1324-20130603/83781_1 /TAXON_ID=236786 /ORGANISM="Florenciella sp., Strain RCC1587" /LENGTH=55 /DNA_ID=CAMNT_0024813869 /DNA_START=36 /DNA_END=200 /DNA_ORIENTATION=-
MGPVGGADGAPAVDAAAPQAIPADEVDLAPPMPLMTTTADIGVAGDLRADQEERG